MSSHLKGFPEIVNQSRSLPGAAPVKHSATVRRGHVSACEGHVPGQAEIAPACRLPETTACKQRQPYREKQGEGLGGDICTWTLGCQPAASLPEKRPSHFPRGFVSATNGSASFACVSSCLWSALIWSAHVKGSRRVSESDCFA